MANETKVRHSLDASSYSEEAQEDLQGLVAALDGFRDPDSKDKAQFAARVGTRHAGVLTAIARMLSQRRLTQEERLFIRAGAFSPDLVSEEVWQLALDIANDGDTDSGVYYIDEWLRLVGSAELAASTADESSHSSRQNKPVYVRRQEARDSLTAQEASFKILLERMAELNDGLATGVAEILDAGEAMLAAMPSEDPPADNYDAVCAKLRQARTAAVSRLLAHAGKVSTIDRMLANEYRDLAQVRALYESLREADGMSEDGPEGPVDVKRVIAELDIVRQMMKMTVGPRGNQFPLLSQEMLRGAPAELVNTRESVRKQLEEVEHIDQGVFIRRFKGADRRIVPHVLIVPAYGARGICWEPWPRDNKGMPGRIVVPLYSANVPNRTVATAIAAYRWQVAKEQAMHYWMEEGLTGQYFQLHASDKHFRHEQEFMKDYVVWITEEVIGRPRLDTPTRALFWRNVPFPQEIREELGQRGVYRILMEKDARRSQSRFTSMGD